MTLWEWWAGEAEDVECEGNYALGGYATCDMAIAAANREWKPGTPFYVIEARSSTSIKHEGADFVPFLRTRNKDRLAVEESA